MKLKTMWKICKATAREFSAVPTLSLAAATAYYAAFSIGPLLVVVIALAGVAFGEGEVKQAVGHQLEGFVGMKSADLVKSMMSAQLHGQGITATLVGMLALAFGATAVFGQLQASLNTIWGIAARTDRGFWLLVRDRLLSMAMVLAIGFLLLVSLALSAFVSAFANYVGRLTSLPEWLVPALDNVISFGLTSLLFALIFMVLPDVKLRWRDVAVGATSTALLFIGGQFLLGVYLRHEISASAYGAGSAFIVILLYIYYAAVVLYIGAEYTKVLAGRRNDALELSPYAVPRAEARSAREGNGESGSKLSIGRVRE
jgi:membrane protein